MGLVSKLITISKAVGVVEMAGENAHFKYKFAKAADIILKVNRACAENGVLMVAEDDITHFEGGGKYVAVKCRLTFRDAESDETLTAGSVGSGTDSGDKAAMKAATAAYKYAIAHAFTMAWGAEDPEEDASTDKAAESKRPESGRPSRSRSIPAVTDTEVLETSIKNAETTEALEKLRPEILKHRGSAAYDGLVQYFRDRMNDIKGE